MKKLLVPLFLLASASLAFADGNHIWVIPSLPTPPTTGPSNYNAFAQLNAFVKDSGVANGAAITQLATGAGRNVNLGFQANVGIKWDSTAINNYALTQTAY